MDTELISETTSSESLEKYSEVKTFLTPLESPEEVAKAYTEGKKLRFSLKFKNNESTLSVWIITPQFENNHISVDSEGFFDGITGYITRGEGVDSYIGDNAPLGIEHIYTDLVIEENFLRFLESHQYARH